MPNLNNDATWSGSANQTTLSKKYTFGTANKYVNKDIEITVNVSDDNLVAENIKDGTTILGINGTLDYIKTVSSVPGTKETSIIFNSTNERYYLWR